MAGLHWTESGCIRLDWNGLNFDWIGLHQTGLDWIWMDIVGLGWTGLDQSKSEQIGLDWTGMEWIGMD